MIEHLQLRLTLIEFGEITFFEGNSSVRLIYLNSEVVSDTLDL